MQPGLLAPGSFPIRDPREPGMKNGRVANGPRYMKMGDLTGQNKWAGKTEFPVNAPTSVSPARAIGEKI